MNLEWDEILASDTPWRRKLRAHQSRYRAEHLKVPPGEDKDGRSLGNLLPAEALDPNSGDPTLNFLGESSVWEYAQEVMARVKEAKGTLEEDRLKRNLLSSMPLCFNLFGYLRQHLELVAGPFSELFGVQMARVTRIECEWAPPTADHLQDKTAFDAVVFFETSAGGEGFIGIETKYSEPFGTQKVSRPERYEKALAELPLTDEFRSEVEGIVTNQVWRNLLLTTSLVRSGGFEVGKTAVVALREDDAASKAVEDVNSRLQEPMLQFCPMEEVVKPFIEIPETSEWANQFSARYFPEGSDSLARPRISRRGM
ncbi:MAG TPA: hypothetical protein VNA87_04140 [Actinomycetota bacterium]|nr:hypothetical protein [Actinomycetota bacterium]